LQRPDDRAGLPGPGTIQLVSEQHPSANGSFSWLLWLMAGFAGSFGLAWWFVWHVLSV